MRALWTGLGIGATVGCIVGLMVASRSDPTSRSEPRHTQARPAAPHQGPDVVTEEPPPAMLVVRSAVRDAAAFAPGTFVVRAGEAYVFGEDAIRPATSAEDDVDVVCQDIRHGAVLRAPYGAVGVPLPLFIPTKNQRAPEALFAAILSAPLDLPQRDASLQPQPGGDTTGLALVTSNTGEVYKLRVVEVHGDPRVWERWVKIEYAQVPQQEGGGGIDFGPPPADSPIDAATIEFLKTINRSAEIPGDSFRKYLRDGGRRIRSLTDLPAELEFTERTHAALPAPLATRIKVSRRSVIIAMAGVARGGAIEITSRTGVAVNGDMEGTIKVGAYSGIHITGDLVGTLDCGSYTTVRIDGDILGTLKVRSYVTLYLGGRFRGPAALDCKGSCWSTFFLDGHWAEHELAAVPATSQVTVHVRVSDLEDGKHKLEPWREVIVGDDLWDRLR